MKVRIYHDPSHTAHDPGPGHPERPARVEACLSGIDIDVDPIQPKPATRGDLARVHDPDYLDALERLCEAGGGWVSVDTFASAESYDVAARACGAVCQAVESALLESDRSFCMIRPPGHHASRGGPMGFCLLNNAAVGAARALEAGAKRVMIFDFDVHHGNGTQEIFWNESRVLYVSVHQWPWYPWRTGGLEEIGGSGAQGTNVNIPMDAGSTDADYLWAIRAVVSPAARAFRPDLILLSAGFDAHERDPLSLMRLTKAGYEGMVEASVALAEELCEGRIVAVLEGGYEPEALSESAAACVGALSRTGRWPVLGAPQPPSVEACLAFHQRIFESR